MHLTSTAALKVPPEMMSELALGMEDGVTVAQRYGYSAADFAVLMGQPWFTKALQTKRDDLEANGFTFRAKMGMLAEDLLVDLWIAAKQSESGSLKLDVAKLFAKLADLEPKPNAQQLTATGSGYQIVINIPDVNSGGADQRAPLSHAGDGGIRGVAHTSVAASNPSRQSQPSNTPPVIDITPNRPQELPEGPRPFVIPDFDLTSDLMGSHPEAADQWGPLGHAGE